MISAKHRPTTPQGVPGGNGLSYPAVDPTDGSLAAVRLDASTGTCWTGSASSTTSTIVLIDPRSGVSEDLLTVTAPPATCSFGIRQPAWSPDGAQIAFQQQSCCVGPNLYQGEIDAVAADGSDGDTYRVAVPATARYLVSSPTWRNAHSLWFQREIQDDGAEDNGLRTKPALFAVRSQEDRFGSRLVRRTDTPRVWEISPSFG